LFPGFFSGLTSSSSPSLGFFSSSSSSSSSEKRSFSPALPLHVLTPTAQTSATPSPFVIRVFAKRKGVCLVSG
jgi:hypothetical protein